MPPPIAAARPPGQASRADALTRHAVTVITAVIALLSFGFSFGNVTADLGPVAGQGARRRRAASRSPRGTGAVPRRRSAARWEQSSSLAPR
jgi:hypothetical protein